MFWYGFENYFWLFQSQDFEALLTFLHRKDTRIELVFKFFFQEETLT